MTKIFKTREEYVEHMRSGINTTECLIKSKKMKTLWKNFWTFIWQTSETLNIPLGKFAPWVFEQMIGIKGIKK